MRRILVAIVLAVAWSGLLNIGASAAATPIVSRLVPAPPAKVGCYRYVNAVWLKGPCDTQASIKKYIPHPELLSGIGGHFKTSTSRFTLSVVSVKAINTQGGSETDNQWGSGAYSLQDNEFFTGSNGQPDGVQFTDQHNPAFAVFGFENNVCVWQVDVTTQNYTSNCASLGTFMPQYVEGTWQGSYGSSGLLTVGAATGSGSAVAVVVPDLYGLGVGHRWNNSSGSILGYGNGSEAVFSNVEAAIGIEVSDCLNDAGFIGYSVFCNGPKLTSLSYVGYAAGPMTQIGTKVYNTLETNNLIPVTGSPPKHLPGLIYFGAYTAQIFYTATTSGKCWTGKAPTCL
jgi:hypothetical protein